MTATPTETAPPLRRAMGGRANEIGLLAAIVLLYGIFLMGVGWTGPKFAENRPWRALERDLERPRSRFRSFLLVT